MADPAHIVPLLTVGTTEPPTVTVAVVVEVQVPLVPVMVYTVVEAGLATTVEPVVALRPVAGLQA
jgi:hypothetical protein